MDAAEDSVISILLHFIMPLSIISTDYMQLELLYSFFYCLHEQTQEDSGYKYTDICVVVVFFCWIFVCFLYSMKKNGSDWHKHGHPGVKNNNGGWLVAFSLFFSFFFLNTILEPPCVDSPKVFIKRKKKKKNK